MFTFKKTVLQLLLGGLVGALTLGGCRDAQDPVLPPDPAQTGQEYYPVAVGRYWEYDVVEHNWQFNVDSVARYQTRERVDTVYQGATGELNYRIVRSRRTDSLSLWREDSSYAVVLTPQLVRRTMGNVPVLDLLFPVREGKYWNPNLFNAADSVARRYEQMGAALTLPNGRRFETTVRVVDDGLISEVDRRERSAAYAWGIGCIYRHRVSFDYCNENEVRQGLCQIGTGYIVRGVEREEQLRAWGPR